MARRLAMAAVFAVIGVACDKPDPSHFDVVRIADRGFLTNAPIYIADEEGYFADEKIKLQFAEPPRSSAQIIPLLDRGDLDVMAPALSAALFAAIAKGSKSRIVADRGHVTATGCDYDGVMVRRGLLNGAPPTANALRGKRFSLGAASTPAYIVNKYLNSLGLSNADIEMVRMGETVEAQALAAGSIDGLHVAEPHLSRLREQGNELIGPASKYTPGMHYAVVVFGPTLTVTHRDVGQRFMKAYLRGVKKFGEGLTARNIDIMARRTNVPADQLRKICLPSINPDGELNFAALVDFQKWLVAGGNLTAVVGPEAATDMTFARTAAKELGIPPTAR
ncbi:MAG: ABC transporter substrate-binding protein [Gemmatimonadales bacterium]